MKIVKSLLFLQLLHIAISLFPSFSLAATKPTPVIDVNGENLRKGVEYYILPADGVGTPGGMGLAKRNTPCAVNVAEDFTPAAKTGGIPVTFVPSNPTDTIINLSTDFNVTFSLAAVCGKSPAWQIGGFEGSTGKWYVITGAKLGSPGTSTVSNWFKIEKFGKYYKLVFCPHVCKFCKVVCGDLGVVSVDGQKRVMGISKVPAAVVFKKKSP